MGYIKKKIQKYKKKCEFKSTKDSIVGSVLESLWQNGPH